MNPLCLTDRLEFGKHRGQQLSTVIREDPTYVEWCLLNISGFELDDRASEEYEREMDYYYAA
jgi:hypothetical protein